VENNAIALLNSTVSGSLNLTNLAGDISANDAITVTGALNITGADSSSVTLNNANNLITGPVSFTGGSGALGDVEFVNGAAVEFTGVNATGLTVTANGSITDNGSMLVVNQASFDAAGNDVIIDEAGNDFGSVSIANAAQVVVNDQSDLGVGSIGGSDIVLNSGGAVTDTNNTGLNISGASLQLSAQSGIGGGNALETQVARMELTNADTGNIEIANSGDLLLVAAFNTGTTAGGVQISTTGSLTQQGQIFSNGNVSMAAGGQYSQLENITVIDSAARINVSSTNDGITMNDAANTNTAGGDISYTASSTVDVSSLDAVYGEGRVEITSFNGDILSTRAPNRARPNVTGGSAFFNAELGTLGTIGRPLVVNVPGAVVINTLTSVDPIYLVTPEPLINQSRVLFGISDAKAEVGGNQRTEVDALAIIDPAIFTKVKNYREDDSPIKLPADQLAEDEEERKHKKKQDPDIFEKEKPFEIKSEPQSSLDGKNAAVP
jgi:ribosomal protein S8